MRGGAFGLALALAGAVWGGCTKARTCRSDADCPAGEGCGAQRCLPRTCPGQTCAKGALCDEGRCRPAACVGVLCAEDHECVKGSCVSRACGGERCPAGLACVDLACVDSACVGAQCPADTTCEQGACTRCGAEVKTCGACGNGCPAPVNAAHACTPSSCGRGACFLGFYDLDGDVTFGCEATCVGSACADGRGKTLVLDAPPLPEATLSLRDFTGGAARGEAEGVSSRYLHRGSFEGAVAAPGADVEATGSRHRHVGGFISAEGP